MKVILLKHFVFNINALKNTRLRKGDQFARAVFMLIVGGRGSTINVERIDMRLLSIWGNCLLLVWGGYWQLTWRGLTWGDWLLLILGVSIIDMERINVKRWSSIVDPGRVLHRTMLPHYLRAKHGVTTSYINKYMSTTVSKRNHSFRTLKHLLKCATHLVNGRTMKTREYVFCPETRATHLLKQEATNLLGLMLFSSP